MASRWISGAVLGALVLSGLAAVFAALAAFRGEEGATERELRTASELGRLKGKIEALETAQRELKEQAGEIALMRRSLDGLSREVAEVAERRAKFDRRPFGGKGGPGPGRGEAFRPGGVAQGLARMVEQTFTGRLPEDLGLDEGQRVKVKAMLKERKGAFNVILQEQLEGKLPPEQFRQRLADLAEKTAAGFREVLTDEQRAVYDENFVPQWKKQMKNLRRGGKPGGGKPDKAKWGRGKPGAPILPFDPDRPKGKKGRGERPEGKKGRGDRPEGPDGPREPERGADEIF